MKRLKHFDAYEIPVGDIFYDEDFNCRGAFTLQSISELAKSIDENGLQFPIVVQPWHDKKFRIIAGHRRFKSVTTILKWDKIPAVIREDLDEHQLRILNLTENLERKDLNMLEEAFAIQGIYPDGVSLRKVSAELKKPTRWVHVRFRLLKLPEEVQKLAAVGRLSAVDIEALFQLPEKDRIKSAEKLVKVKRREGRRLPKQLRRSFRPRKTKEQISKMTSTLMNAGLDGLPTRLLAWAAGNISDRQIRKEIKEHSPHYDFASDEVDI
jgi:ParB family chromosome partitioning protein